MTGLASAHVLLWQIPPGKGELSAAAIFFFLTGDTLSRVDVLLASFASLPQDSVAVTSKLSGLRLFISYLLFCAGA